jgi:hypothetical protein
VNARGEERPFGEEREAHRGREFLGLCGCERWQGRLGEELAYVSNAEVRLHAPYAGGAARDDERGGNAECFERV